MGEKKVAFFKNLKTKYLSRVEPNEQVHKRGKSSEAPYYGGTAVSHSNIDRIYFLQFHQLASWNEDMLTER